MDVQNIAIHELGHSLQRLDLYGTADTEKTMYGIAADGEIKKRTLHADDIAGIRYIYPGRPSLSSPANSSSACDATPYFDWSSVGGAISYHIQVDNNSGFTSPEIDTTTSSSDYTPGSSLSPDTYYWRVRASNSCGDGPWSDSFEVLVLYKAPAPPVYDEWNFMPLLLKQR